MLLSNVQLPSQVAHIPNKIQYNRYHHINMSDFCYDVKDTSFVKSPANAVGDLYV